MNHTAGKKITQVPLLDLTRIHQPIETELKAAFERVLHANAYIMGQEVLGFEQACADYLGVKHAIGVSSGTDALILALMTLDIGPGDEVICPNYTFFATAGCVSRLGAVPVFVDIEAQTYNIAIEQIEAKITERTKAIIPVHLFGLSVDLDPIMAIAKTHGLALIEDAAQAIGAEYKGKKVGSIGDFGCFSFFPAKNLGGFGDGGLLTTQSDELAEKARVLRVHGSKPKYYHHYVGGNFRLDALQAALLKVKLARLESYTEQRRENASVYDELLGDLPIKLPQTLPEFRHVFNQYILGFDSAEQREQVVNAFKKHHIGHAIYYPVPLHLQPCFAELKYQRGDLPIAEQMAETTLAIPIFPGITHDEMSCVSEVVFAALNREKKP